MMVCHISVNTTANETNSKNDTVLDEPSCRAVILTKVITKMGNGTGKEFTGIVIRNGVEYFIFIRSQPHFRVALSAACTFDFNQTIINMN